MQTIIENLTFPKRGWFGLAFGQRSEVEPFLTNAQIDQRALLTIGVDGMPRQIGLDEARRVLDDGQTVYKMYQAGAEFSVPLHYQKLEMSDGHILDLDLSVDLRMTKPIRFFCQNKGRTVGGKLTGELLSPAWSRAFQAAIFKLTHSTSGPDFSSRLTDRAIFGAILPVFTDLSLQDTVGVELIGVRSVKTSSLSYEQQLEREIEQARQDEEQKAKEEERLKLRELQRLKEIELQQQKENRLKQAQETAARMEQQRLEREQKDRAQREKLRYLVLYKNRWTSLTDAEKQLAGQLSDFLRDQAKLWPIPTILPTAQRTDLEIDDSLAQLNVLVQGASLAFTISAPQDGIVTILNLGTSGRLTALVPNSMTGSNGATVHAVKGQTLKLPQSFLPSVDPAIFEEQSDSGLEGIYCLITPEPLIPVACTGRLDDLPTIDYSRVALLIDSLKAFPADAWSVGAMEFKVESRN